MTKMFNSVAAWVVSEIVLVPKLADRVQVPQAGNGPKWEPALSGKRSKWETALSGKRP
jgi:hypothetical protein